MPDTFNAPSIFDESRNLSQWIRYTAEHSPDHPAFAYADPGSPLGVVTWSEVGMAVEQAACLINSMFNLAAVTSRGKSPPVVGILANIDTITYHIIYTGILRAGGTAFLISTKNSPAAICHLLKITGTNKLFVSADDTIQSLVSAAMDLAEKQHHSVTVQTTPTFQSLFRNDGSYFTASAGLETPVNLPAVILHSSGSTSFPKPIALTHHAIVQWATLYDIIGVDKSKTRFAVHALPVFHGMGFFEPFWAIRTGVTLTVFPPRSPPVVPSPSALLESAIASGSTFIFCVPLFLEIWSRDPEAVELLKKFEGIGFAGGPFNHAIGEELVKLGVSLAGLYGTTEIGPGSVLVRRPLRDPEWSWLQLPSKTVAKFLPQDDPNTFELVYVECPDHSPVVFNTTIDGKHAFATNDIVIRHPTNPSMFKIQGRKDDQIMLSSGEKTNPGPIELIISKNPLVEAAVMFGRGRDQNGIIVQPSKAREFDPKDETKLSRFRNEIWSSVAEANDFAPSHSRLFKEMILVTYPSRPIEMTAKHTPRRVATIEAYEEEIKAAYQAVEDSIQTDIPLPVVWNSTEVLQYVRSLVHKIMGKQVKDEDDIFEQGGDSLLATYIRNSLVHTVQQARKGAAANISQSFVYNNPTIVRLAGRLLAIVNTSPGASGDDVDLKLKAMEDTIAEFSAHFPEHRKSKDRSGVGEVVLLTGTTGGLGSQLLVHLASSADVSRIYALNRPSADGFKSLRQRQTEALVERGLDPGIIDSPKVILVEGDTVKADLNVDPDLYNEIRDNITLIIHNAWRVHFNLGFSSFKPNVCGVRTLIDLALGSPLQNPPRFMYLSTVGVFRNWNVEELGKPLELPLHDSKVALGNGYAESKYVGERILENAAASTPLNPVIVRVGQMTGTASGAWNTVDWLPAIVRSGQVIGVLPARSDSVAWIPLETAAQAIFEFRHSESQYLHLAHPNPTSWSALFDVFSSQLDVPLVSWGEWLEKLGKVGVPVERNPAVHLLDFFHGCAPMSLKNREAGGIPMMDLQQALKTSPTLSHPSLPQVCGDDAKKWIRHWKTLGFLSNDSVKLM